MFVSNVNLYEECRGENEDLYEDPSTEAFGDDVTKMALGGEEELLGEEHSAGPVIIHGDADTSISHAHQPHPLDRKCTRLFGVSRNDNPKLRLWSVVTNPRRTHSAEILYKASSINLDVRKKSRVDLFSKFNDKL